jgi:hypothetical protein
MKAPLIVEDEMAQREDRQNRSDVAVRAGDGSDVVGSHRVICLITKCYQRAQWRAGPAAPLRGLRQVGIQASRAHCRPSPVARRPGL